MQSTLAHKSFEQKQTHTYTHTHTHTAICRSIRTHLADLPPPSQTHVANVGEGELEESRVRGVTLAHSPPCSLFLSSIERSSLGHPPDARLCCGAPPCCVHRDLVDAASLAERERRVTFCHCKKGEIPNKLQHRLSGSGAPRRQAASPVISCRGPTALSQVYGNLTSHWWRSA